MSGYRTIASMIELISEIQEGAVELVAGRDDLVVREVVMMESLDRVHEFPADSLIILDADAAHANTYRFDIAIRRAHNGGASGVLLATRDELPLSLTAIAMCEKTGLALIRSTGVLNVMSLLRSIAADLTDDLHLTIERAEAALATIHDVHTPLTREEFLALGSRLVGRSIAFASRSAVDPSAMIAVPASVVDPDSQMLVVGRSANGGTDTLSEMLLWRLAAEYTATEQRERRTKRLTRQSLGEILLQLIESNHNERALIADAAVRSGLPIDHWHVIVHLQLDNLRALSPDEIAAIEQRSRLADAVSTLSASIAGQTFVAETTTALVLVISRPAPYTAGESLKLIPTIDALIARLVAMVPGLVVYAGMGSPNQGAAGLSLSAQEAKLAHSSSRARRRSNRTTSFDALGLRSGLVEWYASPSVQESIASLVEPLATLGTAKKEAILDTLTTYLGCNSSVSKTAVILHLHRNAVRYRLQRAFELLQIDEDDADQRLFLHLALKSLRPSAPHDLSA